MTGFFPPALWVILGASGVFMWSHLSSDRCLAGRTEEERQRLREGFASRFPQFLTGTIALYCLFGTIAAIWTGRSVWWMWLLATLAHLGVLVARQRAVARVYAYDGQRPAPTTPQERTRQRYVISYTTVAVLAFVAARAVMPPPESADAEAPRVIGALVLITVAGLAALAAGWSAIWAFKNPRTPHSDRPTSGT